MNPIHCCNKEKENSATQTGLQTTQQCTYLVPEDGRRKRWPEEDMAEYIQRRHG